MCLPAGYGAHKMDKENLRDQGNDEEINNNDEEISSDEVLQRVQALFQFPPSPGDPLIPAPFKKTRAYIQALGQVRSKNEVRRLVRLDKLSITGALLGMIFASIDVFSDVSALHAWVSMGWKLWVAGFIILALSFFANICRVMYVRKEVRAVREYYMTILRANRAEFCPTLDNPESPEQAGFTDPNPNDIDNNEDDSLILPKNTTDLEESRLIELLDNSIPNLDSPFFVLLFTLSALAPSILLNTIWLIGVRRVRRLLDNPRVFSKSEKLFQLYSTSSFLFFVQFQAADACKLELLIEAIPQLLLRILPVLAIFLKLDFNLARHRIGDEEVEQVLISFLSIGYLMTASMMRKFPPDANNTNYPKILQALCVLGHILTIGTIIVGAALLFLSSVLTGLGVFLVCNFAVMPRPKAGISLESRLFQGWSKTFSPLAHVRRKSLCLRIICRMFLLRSMALSLVLTLASLQLTLWAGFPQANVITVSAICLSIHLLGDTILILERILGEMRRKSNPPILANFFPQNFNLNCINRMSRRSVFVELV